MKNKLFQMGILIFALVFGMMVIGCDNGGDSGDSSYNNDAGEFAGTWSGSIGTYGTAIVTISNSGWSASVEGYPFDKGKFNRSGNSATLYSDTVQKVVGTATFTNSNTATLVLNENSVAPGTYTFTKQQ